MSIENNAPTPPTPRSESGRSTAGHAAQTRQSSSNGAAPSFLALLSAFGAEPELQSSGLTIPQADGDKTIVPGFSLDLRHTPTELGASNPMGPVDRAPDGLDLPEQGGIAAVVAQAALGARQLASLAEPQATGGYGAIVLPGMTTTATATGVAAMPPGAVVIRQDKTPVTVDLDPVVTNAFERTPTRSATDSMLLATPGPDQPVAVQAASAVPVKTRARWVDAQANADTAKPQASSSLSQMAEPRFMPGAATLATVAGMVKEFSGTREPERVPSRWSGAASGFEPAAPGMPAGLDPSVAFDSSAYVMDPLKAPGDVTIAQRVHYWVTRGVQSAELQLDSPGGGSVDVSVSVQGNEATVEFRSDQPEARKLLNEAMPQLRDMLKSEGLMLCGGFVGTSAQRDSGAQAQRRDGMREASLPAPADPAQARGPQRTGSSGSSIDVFV